MQWSLFGQSALWEKCSNPTFLGLSLHPVFDVMSDMTAHPFVDKDMELWQPALDTNTGAIMLLISSALTTEAETVYETLDYNVFTAL
jgi:hypothetical protein